LGLVFIAPPVATSDVQFLLPTFPNSRGGITRTPCFWERDPLESFLSIAAGALTSCSLRGSSHDSQKKIVDFLLFPEPRARRPDRPFFTLALFDPRGHFPPLDWFFKRFLASRESRILEVLFSPDFPRTIVKLLRSEGFPFSLILSRKHNAGNILSQFFGVSFFFLCFQERRTTQSPRFFFLHLRSPEGLIVSPRSLFP